MKKIFVKTFGCSLNLADSERIMGVLKENGYGIASDVTECDLVIVNSCTVKGATVRKIEKYVKGLDVKVIVAGCLAQVDSSLFESFSVIGPSQLENIVSIVEETLNGNIVQMLEFEKDDKIKMPVLRSKRVVAIVPIAQGCKGSCTYCAVRKARGKLQSYNISQIVDVIRSSSGVKEVWLTGQDTGCYGHDIGTNIIELLNLFFVRF